MQMVKDDDVKRYADFDNRERVHSAAKNRRPGKTIPVIDFSAYSQNGMLGSANGSPARCTIPASIPSSISSITAFPKPSANSRMIGADSKSGCS
jgi:hypothetical protein